MFDCSARMSRISYFSPLQAAAITLFLAFADDMMSWSKMISRVIFCLIYRKHHFCVSYKRPPWKKSSNKKYIYYPFGHSEKKTKKNKNSCEYLPAIERFRVLMAVINISCCWCSNSFSSPPKPLKMYRRFLQRDRKAKTVFAVSFRKHWSKKKRSHSFILIL